MVVALVVYDWLLCFSQEVSLIWTWRSRGVTVAFLVYVFSRYTWLIESLLGVATIYPMSDLVRRLTTTVSSLFLILSPCLYPEVLPRDHILTITELPLLYLLRHNNSCRANVWIQSATGTMNLIAISSGFK